MREYAFVLGLAQKAREFAQYHGENKTFSSRLVGPGGNMMKKIFADPSVSGDEMARSLAVYSCRLVTGP